MKRIELENQFKGIDLHSKVDNTTDEQLLDRIIEECLEVAHSVSKMVRFGINGNHPTYYNGRSNVDHFFDEWKQLTTLVEEFDDRLDVRT